MQALHRDVRSLAAATRFSGVVRVDVEDEPLFVEAYGLANRAHAVANNAGTQFGIASGTKGLTAVVVASLVADGTLGLATPARALLGSDLPLIRDDVTIEHLLAHRSGIGDYLDEDDVIPPTSYVLQVPAHELASTDDYLTVLDGHPPKFAAGEKFSYCNSGYVVLALVAERAARTPFEALVETRVCAPAGMAHTAFLRSDELPGTAATGYLDETGLRTNVLHLPVRGSGDGGIYATAADASAFWRSLFGGTLLPLDRVSELLRSRSDVPAMRSRYGLGFWLDASTDAVFLEGSDAGVSFRTVHHRAKSLTYTVVSNTTAGAWPLVRLLRDRFADA